MIGGYLSCEFTFEGFQKLKKIASKSQQGTIVKVIISPDGMRKTH
jgi:hypothetical protein